MIKPDTRPRRRNSTKADDAKRSDRHARWIRRLPCFFAKDGQCSGPIEAAHIDHEGSKGVGSKCGDWALVPLCSGHHQEMHKGAETFEQVHNINMVDVAEAYVASSPERRDLQEKRAAWRAQHLPRLEVA